MKIQAAENEPVYRVLIVDDDGMIRNLISTILSTKRHLLEQASSGKEALEKAIQGKFDAAVVDVVMPGMDGITLTRELLKRLPDLPVMIMTGYSQTNYMKMPINEAAFVAGAVEFIDKPFTVHEFSTRFHKMVLNHKILMQTKARQREIERMSSQIIADMQKESGERIDTLQKELEDLRSKLTRLESDCRVGGGTDERKKIPEPDERPQGPEGPDVDLVKALQKKLGVIQKNRQSGPEKDERHG